MTTMTKPIITNQKGEPAWAVAELFPPQGFWSEEEYLSMTDGTNRRVELVNGCLEVLPMPTEQHQDIFDYLYIVFRTVAQHMGGKVYAAGMRVRLGGRHFREPDIVFMRSKLDPRRGNRYWRGADLAVEIVSDDPKDRERDLVTKRQEYAQAGILEYWIVDPENETINVLTLQGDQYAEHGHFMRGQTAT
ncbi:MAG: Uma2 family endonuclease, partial [Chloroflexota bacterium]